MSAQTSRQQGTTFGPSLLTVHQVTKLTDAAMELFHVLYDLERAQKQTAKARLTTTLSELDPFSPTLHYNTHEDYTPTGDDLS